MTTWTPAEKDLHPLQVAIHDLARHYLMPSIVRPPAPRGAEGWHSLVMPDGRRAAIFIEVAPRTPVKYGPRAAIAYDVKGRATLETDGYLVSGEILVDQATRAFLKVDCALQALGRVA